MEINFKMRYTAIVFAYIVFFISECNCFPIFCNFNMSYKTIVFYYIKITSGIYREQIVSMQGIMI